MHIKLPAPSHTAPVGDPAYICGPKEPYPLSPEQRELYEALEPNGLYILAEETRVAKTPCLYGLAWRGGPDMDDIRVMQIMESPPQPSSMEPTSWTYSIRAPDGFDKTIVNALKVSELTAVQFSQVRDRLCFLMRRSEHPEDYTRTITQWMMRILAQLVAENIIQLGRDAAGQVYPPLELSIEAQRLGQEASGGGGPPRRIVRRSTICLFPVDYAARPFRVIGGFVHGHSVIMGPPVGTVPCSHVPTA